MADPERALRFYAGYARGQAWLTLALGLGTVAFTGPLMSLLGLAIDDASVLGMRAFGVSLLFVSAVHAGTRDTRELSTVLGVARANLLEDGILTIVMTSAILAGTAGPVSWVLVAAFGAEAALALWLERSAASARSGSPGHSQPT